MNSSVAGWLLCLTALCLWGSIGTLAKASAVQWSLFFKAYSVGVGATALVLAVAAAPEVRAIGGHRGATFYGIFGGLCGCGGSMCFLSSIEMVSVTLSYPVVMGIEMTLGTFLLYLLDRDALNVGPLVGALCCVLGAVALDALAQLRLADNEPRGAPPEEDGLLGTPALKRGRSLGKVEFLPEGDDDELDYVFDSDHSDDACVPIERLVDALSPTKTKNQWDDKPQGVRRGVRRAVAAGVLLSFWPAGEALAVDAGATVPAFMVVLGLSHLLFCLILLPVRAAYLRRSGSKQPPSVGICSAAWGYGFVAGAAWFCGAVLVFVAGEDIGVTVAVSVARCSPTVAALWGLFYWGEAEHASPRALAYIGAMLCLYGAAIVLIARSSAA